MRPVSRQINEAIEDGFHNANFGLVFNKWLDVHESGRNIFKTTIHQDKRPLIDAYTQCASPNSLVMKILRAKHIQQENYCKAMEAIGYSVLSFEAELTSPFISGLGMTHPTETGMVIDWNTGLPYIPASSQKGILRVAYAINALQAGNSDQIVEKNGEVYWHADEEFLTLFGYAPDRERDNGLVGRLIILDAYPLSVPRLAEDILNPHYPDYYAKKKDREGNQIGPTEDQSPKPIKFLVVEKGTRFLFRVLLRHPLAGDRCQDAERLIGLVIQTMKKSLEEGVGAKTSLGYGRFVVLDKNKEQTTTDTDKQKGRTKNIQVDPVKERQKRVEQFVQSLPKPAELPGRAAHILEQIKGFEDPELRQACLNELRTRFKDMIKNGKKKKKKWAMAILAQCEAEGV